MLILVVSFFCLFFLLILWLLLICPSEAPEELYRSFIGHSFAREGLRMPGDEPEDLLSACRKAVSFGYGLEIPVGLSKDGQITVLRGETHGRKVVMDESAQKNGEASPDGMDDPGTLLKEILALAAGQVPVIIDVLPCAEQKELARLVLDALSSYEGPVCIESLDPLLLYRIRRADRTILRGQRVCRSPFPEQGVKNFFLRNLLCDLISQPHLIAYDYRFRKNLSCRAAVRLLHGVPAAWMVCDRETFYKLYDEGVDIQTFEGFLPPVFITDAEEPSSEPVNEESDGTEDVRAHISE